MTLLNYVDNEVVWDGDYGEWDLRTQAGGSTITQSADASFPDRGSYGLRCRTAVGNLAYMQKTITTTIAAGGSLFFGYWFKINVMPTSYTYTGRILNSAGAVVARLYLSSTGKMQFGFYNDAGALSFSGATTALINDGNWHYMVVEIVRATTSIAADGILNVWVDGSPQPSTATVDNYDKSAIIGTMRFGCTATARVDTDLFYDEIKVSTTYPLPYLPTPSDELPTGNRTVVLFKEGNSDSAGVASYACEQLDIPLAMRIPLPNATTTEAAASYATWQTEVEDDIDTWFVLNTEAATNVTSFIVGHNVPGYFTDSGTKHSATSRLQNYGTVFSSQTTNPLYNPATVARLTKTLLAGQYLATRVDSDTLAHSKTIIDRAVTVSALTTIPADEIFFSSETAYLASVGFQNLRIDSSAMALFEDDAFVWGNPGSYSYTGTASRITFGDTVTNGGDSLRGSWTGPFASIHAAEAIAIGYASSLGWSATAGTFDADSFFQMLRLGGTFAEACMVSTALLDYHGVHVGAGLATAQLKKDGYTVYRGIGTDVGDVDVDTPLAHLQASNITPTLTGLGHAVSTKYTYLIRPTRVTSDGSELETQDLSNNVVFETDAAGEWIGTRPAQVLWVLAEVKDDGDIKLSWEFRNPSGYTAPDHFNIYYSNDDNIEPDGAGQTTEDYTTGKVYTKTIALSDGLTYYFGITGESAGGVESYMSVIIGPYVADAAGPDEPVSYIDQAW